MLLNFVYNLWIRTQNFHLFHLIALVMLEIGHCLIIASCVAWPSFHCYLGYFSGSDNFKMLILKVLSQPFVQVFDIFPNIAFIL